MSDIVERLRSSQPLPICPFDKKSPDYYTTPNDKPCKFCGGEPEGPDRCTGADTRIMGEAADIIDRLRQLLSEAEKREREARATVLEDLKSAAERVGKRDAYSNDVIKYAFQRGVVAAAKRFSSAVSALQSEER